ncbi:MAG: substrate-binding domain-containing protein [Kiritimatiellae bacterium]|nr:substrate-binding domain-containing protein [Kiritimatiellia bacterium]
MSSKQLKYKEVETELRQLAKTLPPGAKIPPERHLAITYDCSFLTVRKAMKALVEDGIIVRRVGSGSFVTDKIKETSTPTHSSTGVKRRKNFIGLLVYQHGNAYAHKMLQSIAHSAMEMGVELRPSWVTHYDDTCLKQAQSLRAEGCVALVLPWFPAALANEVAEFVEKSPLPVSIPLLIPGFEKNYFGVPELFGNDLFRTTRATCHYFKELGRTHIAYVGPVIPENFVLQKMLATYTAFVSTHHLDSLSFLASPGSASMDYLADIWKPYKGSLGIVCYDDEHALRLMTAMNKIGLQAPDDFTIIGYNNNEAGKFSDPPLTTIDHDFVHASDGLLTNALALSRNQTVHTESIPKPKLLIRGSCGGVGKIDKKIQSAISPFLELVENEPPPNLSDPMTLT